MMHLASVGIGGVAVVFAALAAPVVVAVTPGTAASANVTTYVSCSGVSWPEQVAASACAGLYNRNASWSERGAAYLLNNGNDAAWLQNVLNITNPQPTVDVPTFVKQCADPSGVTAGKYITYNASSQQASRCRNHLWLFGADVLQLTARRSVFILYSLRLVVIAC